VIKRDEWVLWTIPENSMAKSTANGAAAMKSHFRGGVSMRLNDRANG
jgi:hypothetical protein